MFYRNRLFAQSIERERSVADIKFSCPKCNGHIVSDEGGISLTVTCPHCNAHITVKADDSPEQRLPVPPPPALPPVVNLQPVGPSHLRFRGPPHECWHCGGGLRKEREAKHSGSGCLIILVGLLLAPVLIGIPIIIYGLHLGSKAKGFWRCRKCGAEFPRKLNWYELG